MYTALHARAGDQSIQMRKDRARSTLRYTPEPAIHTDAQRPCSIYAARHTRAGDQSMQMHKDRALSTQRGTPGPAINPYRRAKTALNLHSVTRQSRRSIHSAGHQVYVGRAKTCFNPYSTRAPWPAINPFSVMLVVLCRRGDLPRSMRDLGQLSPIPILLKKAYILGV